MPKDAICFFRDGDQWCCVFGDFADLQKSPAGFGATQREAFADLVEDLPDNVIVRRPELLRFAVDL